MKRLLIVLAGLLLLALPPTSGASSPFSIDITPWGFAHPPVDMHVHVHIERNAKYRWAAVIIRSEDYFRESDFSVAGEGAPTIFNFDCRNLREGKYQGFVEIFGEENKDLGGAVSKTLTILSTM
jgi:hypothetical protein